MIAWHQGAELVAALAQYPSEIEHDQYTLAVADEAPMPPPPGGPQPVLLLPTHARCWTVCALLFVFVFAAVICLCQDLPRCDARGDLL